MNRLRFQHGISILELILFWSGLVAWGGTYVAKLMGYSQKSSLLVDRADAHRDVTLILDRIRDDLKEANPSSIPWANLPQDTNASSFAFDKTIYDPNLMTTRRIEYRYEYKNSDRTLVRVETKIFPSSSTITTDVLLRNLAPPTTSTPLFEQDIVNPQKMIIVNVTYAPPRLTPAIQMTRRVAIRG